MAYSINPNLPKARAIALRLLIQDGLPIQTVANRCGVNRTTIWRWHKKWKELNQNVSLVNHGRPTRLVVSPNALSASAFRQSSLHWNIATVSSRPHSHPNTIPEFVVKLVLQVRRELKRCAEIVWWHVNEKLGVRVSLSSVRRILKRHGYTNGRKKRIRPDNPRRPKVTRPGELVQTDTIHHVDPWSNKRMYVYTVIDLYTRMTHAVVAPKCLPGLAASVVLEAEKKFGFKFSMVQADNGPEYRQHFEQLLARHNIPVRHTRLQRPNDNAHIERYNRTIQDECIGYYWKRNSLSLTSLQKKVDKYLDYYNHERIHLGLQYRTPAEMLQRL